MITLTALVTPFISGGDLVDYDSLERLVDFQKNNQKIVDPFTPDGFFQSSIDGLVVGGTTGEASTLLIAEHTTLIRHAARHVSPAFKIVAGIGSNNTLEAKILLDEAKHAGCSAVMAVVPYYNRPCQEGIFRHFEALSKAAEGMPIMLYDVPHRTGVKLSMETLFRVVQLPNIAYFKDAGGDPSRQTLLRRACEAQNVRVPLVFSGDDGLTNDFLAEGAAGVVSVISNYAPAAVARNEELSGITPAFPQRSIAYAKHKLHEMGIISSPDVRLPLVPYFSENQY